MNLYVTVLLAAYLYLGISLYSEITYDELLRSVNIRKRSGFVRIITVKDIMSIIMFLPIILFNCVLNIKISGS